MRAKWTAIEPQIGTDLLVQSWHFFFEMVLFTLNKTFGMESRDKLLHLGLLYIIE